MTSRCGSTGDNSKCNADGKSPTDLEDGAKGSHSQLVVRVQDEARDGRNAGKAVHMRSEGSERGILTYT